MKFNPLKESPIKLGQIKNGKLEKFGKDICWNLDRTIAIFLRDTLRHFADTTQSFPDCYDDNWDKMTVEQWQNRDKERDGYKIWVTHIREIADKINFYLKDAEEFLDEEDKEFLSTYHVKYPIRFEPAENGLSQMVDDAPEEDKRKYLDIIGHKTVIIEQNQLTSMQEALHDIAKIFPNLWD